MNSVHETSSNDDTSCFPLLQLLEAVAPGERGRLLQTAVSFRPGRSLDESFAVGPLRAAFAAFWEAETGRAIEPADLRKILEAPIPIRTILAFSKLALAGGANELASELRRLVRYLQDELVCHAAQLRLFEGANESQAHAWLPHSPVPGSVRNLQELVDTACRFPTIYADPPWPYENEASRGAAVNHYPPMSLDEILAEPVRELVNNDAHLHLWTTNAFLREAFDVIDAWGFQFKSCLVWIKSELGMGNYWRVSHEFLLLGVRGSLTFRDRTLPSWVQASRTIHSRKPAIIRALIERVSPGPYLELYGREELPDSAWTVYGNDVEPRFL